MKSETFQKQTYMQRHVYNPADFNTRSCLHALFSFFRPDSKIWIRHETDRQKCHGGKNTGKCGVSAIRIQWKTPRTQIRPKSQKKNKIYFAHPSNPGNSVLLNISWAYVLPAAMHQIEALRVQELGYQ